MPPLDVILWTFLAAYIVHIIDETIIGEGFTKKIQLWFWPQYHIGMFFWFNFACIASIALSNALYDMLGGHWVILALLWPFGFATHGVTLHLWWSIRHRAYFSGLLTSPLYWIIVYFIVRYAYLPGQISHSDFVWGVALGVGIIGGFLTFAPTYVFPALARRRQIASTKP
jgi:hypothetical protein